MIILSLSGNIYLIWLFVSALIFPYKNIEFLSSIGPAIFVIEFLSVHASGMAQGNFDSKTRLKLIFFYLAFLVPIFSISKSWNLVTVFVISIVSKILFRATSNSDKFTVYSVFAIFGTFFILFFSFIWNMLFKLPSALQNELASRGKGLVYESPQTFMVWGIVYFSLLTFIEIYLKSKEGGGKGERIF